MHRSIDRGSQGPKPTSPSLLLLRGHRGRWGGKTVRDKIPGHLLCTTLSWERLHEQDEDNGTANGHANVKMENFCEGPIPGPRTTDNR